MSKQNKMVKRDVAVWELKYVSCAGDGDVCGVRASGAGRAGAVLDARRIMAPHLRVILSGRKRRPPWPSSRECF